MAQGGESNELREAQQQLAAAGLYHGPIDGVMDPDTRAAIANFQQQRGLPRTEQLDQQTMAQLRSAQTAGSGSSTPGASPIAPAGQMPTGPRPASQGSTGPTPSQPGTGSNTTGQPPAR